MSSPVAKPKISQPWGRPNDRYQAKRHTGIDYAAPVGTPVLAVADGVISNVMTDKSYGEVVVLKADKYEIWYCHLSVKGVKKGDKVSVGQELGKSGNTGNSTGPHLHLETRIAPFRYGNDVSCPFIDDPATIDPNAPADRKVGLMAKAVAVVTPAKTPATKIVKASNVKTGAKNADVEVVQSALIDIVDKSLKATGNYDDATKKAYQKWQVSLGYKGTDADGLVGVKSLTALGKKYGFSVV